VPFVSSVPFVSMEESNNCITIKNYCYMCLYVCYQLTTDLRHVCTESHTGTSASAPLAGGICALALQAKLVKHLVYFSYIFEALCVGQGRKLSAVKLVHLFILLGTSVG